MKVDPDIGRIAYFTKFNGFRLWFWGLFLFGIAAVFVLVLAVIAPQPACLQVIRGQVPPLPGLGTPARRRVCSHPLDAAPPRPTWLLARTRYV